MSITFLRFLEEKHIIMVWTVDRDWYAGGRVPLHALQRSGQPVRRVRPREPGVERDRAGADGQEGRPRRGSNDH